MIIGVTAVRLQNIEWQGFNEQTLSAFTEEANCLLGTSINSESLCTYAYVACGASIGVTLLLMMLSCVFCACCGCGGVLDAAIAGVATVWWAVAGGVLTANAVKANRAGWPAGLWRTVVFCAAWAAAGLFALVALVHMCAPSSMSQEPDMGGPMERRMSNRRSRRALREQRSVYAQFSTNANPYRAFKPEARAAAKV